MDVPKDIIRYFYLSILYAKDENSPDSSRNHTALSMDFIRFYIPFYGSLPNSVTHDVLKSLVFF